MRKSIVVALLVCSCGVAGLAVERQPNGDYHARRENLAKMLNGGAALVFAGTEPSTGNAIWGFHQEANFYYLTGWTEPGAAVLIVAARPEANGRPAREYSETLFLPTRNMVQERWTGPKLGPENPDAPRLSGFDHVADLSALSHTLSELTPPLLYVDAGRSTIPPSETAELVHGLMGLGAFPNGVTTQDVRPLLGELRKVKDHGEIELVRKATDTSVAAHLAAMHAMKPNVTEREISGLMQYEFEKRGCERPAYAPIVGAGYYSTVLHYSADSGVAHDGDVVVIDVGGEYSMYATDITRTLPANGHFSARQREIYNVVLGAQQAAIDSFVSGKSTITGTAEASLDRVAREFINSHGKDLKGQALGQYFIHGLGHFVGLDVHDPGDSSKPLGPGMIFTIEPGVYIPDEKIGVRVEDTFLVGEDGKLVKLSGALPSKPEEVERAMQGK
jgi:Xaa-Pro aminopeptidase